MNLENAQPHQQVNFDAFYERLKIEYTRLFVEDPEYAFAASRTTPEALARKMTIGLDSGSANKDGEGIKATCKHFGIAHTYKAIRQFIGTK